MTPTLGLLPLLAISAALTGPAFGQVANTEPEELAGTVELDTVVVDGDGTGRNTNNAAPGVRRIPTTIQDTPQVVNVITAEQIQERGLTNLRDVLTRVPGVTMSAGEGGGGGMSGDSFNIRGFSAIGNIFVDGVRDIGIYSRDPFNLEQVEVYKGGAGAVLGRGGGGGSINLQTKRPRSHFFAEALATIGTDSYYRGSIDINTPLNDDVAFRFNAVGLDRDFAERDHVHQERWAIAPTITFGMTGDTQLTLAYVHQEDDGRPDNGVPRFGRSIANGGDGLARPVTTLGVDRSNYYGFLEDFESSTVDLFTATLEHEFTPDLSFSHVLRLGSYETDRWVTVPATGGLTFCSAPTDPSCAMGGNIASQSRGMEGWTFQNQSTLNAAFNTGVLSHELVLGLDVSRENVNHLGYDERNAAGGTTFPPINVPNPDLISHGLTRTLDTNTEHVVDTVGFTAYDRVHLGSGFYAIGNGRVERYSVDTVALNGNTGSIDQTLYSWQGALEYKPFEEHTYYVSVSNTEVPPSVTSGYQNNPLTEADRPESTRTYEVGAKWNLFDGQLGLGASVFQIEREDERIVDAFGNVEINEDSRRIRGIELSAQGYITDQLTVSAGYAYLHGRVQEGSSAGAIVGLTPEHSGYVWIDYRFTEQFKAGIGATYTDVRYTGDYNPDSQTALVGRLPDQFVVDVSADWQVTDNFALQFNGLNIFNEETFESSHGARHMVPGTGRTLLLTAKTSF